jgi:hypothetical protein
MPRIRARTKAWRKHGPKICLGWARERRASSAFPRLWLRNADRSASDKQVPVRLVHGVFKEPVLVLMALPRLECQCSDLRREGNKKRAYIPEDRRARRGIHGAPVVNVHTYQATFFLDGDLDLPFHVGGLRPGICPDQEHVRTGHVDLLAAPALDVLLVVGFEGVGKLASRRS